MPHGEKSKGKSWSSFSIRNMLGRKRAKNGSSRSLKDPAMEDGRAAAECTSIKERVLAKLQEPLPNEKEAARHSVDGLRAPLFSPRLSYDGHEHFSQLKDAFAAAAGQGYRDAQPPRHSTSVWQQFERESVQSKSSSSSSAAFQASPSASTSSTAASILGNVRSTQQHGFSSPVASNVIARLMGLEELDAQDSSSHMKFKHSLLRAEEASTSEPSRGSPRQGPGNTRQGRAGRNEDVLHSRNAWNFQQEKSPCLQPKQPRARGKPVEEVARSPRQQRHVFLSHGCIPGNQGDEKRSPPREPTRDYYRTERRKDCAQDFLDEMEEELKQCDKALERIEAVMQLKRRLLYLNRSAEGVVEHNSFLDYNRSIHSRCNGRFEKDSNSIYRNAQHVRAHSLDHHRQRVLWEEEQSWDRMQQLPEDGYYSNTKRRRCRNEGHPAEMKDNRSRDMESQSPRPVQQPQMHKRFLHRRSVSDGETPVFSPSEGTYNFEAASRACIAKVMAPSSPVFNLPKDSELLSDVPKTPEHRPQNRCSSQFSGAQQKMTNFFQVEEACRLSRRSMPQIQHKPVPDTICEQPSPVSVLDNAQDDSPRSSEDYEAFKPAKNLDNSIERDEVGSAENERKSVVRALWRDNEEEKPEEEAKQRSCLVFRPQPEVRDSIQDVELVKEMQESWSGFRSEIAEVALVAECMILKTLVEETIIYMMP